MRYDTKTVKRIMVVASGLLLIAGCTSSDSFTQSVRPLYQAQGEAPESSHYVMGKQYFSEGRYGLALEAFQAELNRNQRSVPALNGIAACYDQMKRYGLALGYYYKALQIQPNSVKTLSNLGYSYILQERIQEADKVLRLALHYNPENDRVKEHLAYIARTYPSLAEAGAPAVQAEQQAGTGVSPEAGKPDHVVAKSLPVVPEALQPEPVVESAVVEPEVQAIATERAATMEARQPAPDAKSVEASKETAAVPNEEKDGAGMFQGVTAFFKSVGEKVLALISPEEEVTQAEVAAVETSGSLPATKPEQEAVETIVATVSEPVEVKVTEAPMATVEQGDVPSEAAGSGATVSAQGALAELKMDEIESVSHQGSGDDVLQKAEVETSAKKVNAIQSVEGSVAGLDSGQPPVAVVRNVPQTVAVAAPRDEAIPASSESRIEVSNGNGSPGHAHLLAIYLKGHGERIWRITNADTFAYQSSVIFYRPGNKLDAERLANRLPVEVELKRSDKNYPGITARLVLGQELVAYRASVSREIEQMQAEGLYAQNYNFRDEPVMVVTIEVSNGNGANGMARLLRDVLTKQGRIIKRVTNAASFGHENTVIYYQPGHLNEALQVASQLPVEAKLEEADISRRNVEMRIIMGRDFINFKAAMELLVAKDA